MIMLQLSQGVDLLQADLQQKMLLKGVSSVGVGKIISEALQFFVFAFVDEAVEEGLPI